MAENKKMVAAPRCGLNPDGEFKVYDEKGEEISLPKHQISKEKFEQILEGKTQTGHVIVEMRSGKSNPVCYVTWVIDHKPYCFKIDCLTGAYLGMC